jgi:hypothetical protein
MGHIGEAATGQPQMCVGDKYKKHGRQAQSVEMELEMRQPKGPNSDADRSQAQVQIARATAADGGRKKKARGKRQCCDQGRDIRQPEEYCRRRK